MRAVVIEEYGSPEVLQLRELPNLEPSHQEVRVKVRAFYSLNRADIEERKGNYPPPIPSQYEIPGLEFAGVVDKLGEGVNNWQLGDRVFGLLVAGGYAEQVLIHERMLMPIPPHLSFDQAAAIPEVFFTAYDALIDKANFQTGDTVLIHAGASGVGTAAYLEKNLNAAALEGRIVQIAMLSGASAEINLQKILSKRLRLQGTTLRSPTGNRQSPTAGDPPESAGLTVLSSRK